MNGVVIGREREIAEANGFLAEAAECSCGLLLAGEPGIGKTTIWSKATFKIVLKTNGRPTTEARSVTLVAK